MAAEFKEVGRTALTDQTELVISQVVEGGLVKGLALNKYTTSPTFSGFGKGLLVPVERYADALALLTKALGA